MAAFTLFHVALSLAGIFAGFVVVVDMLKARASKTWTSVFLWTTLATSVTGFMFPFRGFTPAIGVGIMSMLVLAPTFYAYYAKRLGGAWRWVYVLGALLALYLNFFVLIVQGFLKVPLLNSLAPTQTEPPFAIAQGVALLGFVVLAVQSLRRFRPVPATAN